MNPKKSIEQQLRNQITVFARENAELKAKIIDLYTRKEAKKRKAERINNAKKSAKSITIVSLKGLAVATGAAIAFYCLVWCFEPLVRQTYKGKVIAIETSITDSSAVFSEKCKITQKNGQLNYEYCDENSVTKKITDYRLIVAFLNAGGATKVAFSTKNNGWELPWNQAKLPFPENFKSAQLYVGGAIPYIGCDVEVYDLRGVLLNSRSLAKFVANASMCKKPASSRPEK